MLLAVRARVCQDPLHLQLHSPVPCAVLHCGLISLLRLEPPYAFCLVDGRMQCMTMSVCMLLHNSHACGL